MSHIVATFFILVFIQFGVMANPYENWKEQILTLVDEKSISVRGIPSLIHKTCTREEWVQKVDVDATVALYAQVPKILQEFRIEDFSTEEMLKFFGECAFLNQVLNAYCFNKVDLERHLHEICHIEEELQKSLVLLRLSKRTLPIPLEDLSLATPCRFLKELQDTYFPVSELSDNQIKTVWISNFLTLNSKFVAPDSFPLSEIFSCMEKPKSVMDCYNSLLYYISENSKLSDIYNLGQRPLYSISLVPLNGEDNIDLLVLSDNFHTGEPAVVLNIPKHETYILVDKGKLSGRLLQILNKLDSSFVTSDEYESLIAESTKKPLDANDCIEKTLPARKIVNSILQVIEKTDGGSKWTLLDMDLLRFSTTTCGVGFDKMRALAPTISALSNGCVLSEKMLALPEFRTYEDTSIKQLLESGFFPIRSMTFRNDEDFDFTLLLFSSDFKKPIGIALLQPQWDGFLYVSAQQDLGTLNLNE